MGPTTIYRIAIYMVMPVTEMSTVVDGIRLAYWRSQPVDRNDAASGPGAGCTVLLLHGLAADHEGLRPLASAWPGADVIAPDLPGFGLSQSLTADHSVINYARVLDAFCARLDLPDLIVVGHSLGASIGLALAAIYPHRVQALVLLSPVTTGTGVYSRLADAYYHLGSLLPSRAARIWFLSRPAVYLGDRSIITTTDRRVRRHILHEDYRTAALTNPHVIPEIYRSIRSTVFTSLAEAVQAPTLVVGAVRDALAPPEALATLHRHLARSELVIIPDAGHLWAAEEPEAAARVIASAVPALSVRVNSAEESQRAYPPSA